MKGLLIRARTRPPVLPATPFSPLTLGTHHGSPVLSLPSVSAGTSVGAAQAPSAVPTFCGTADYYAHCQCSPSAYQGMGGKVLAHSWEITRGRSRGAALA